MFACIYIADFPVEAIVRSEPLLRERAVAVLEGKPPSTRVIALNEHARRMGMEVGMTKLQAAIFTPAVLRERSIEQEKSAHSALLDMAFGFSPRVEDTANGRLLLDLAGLERLHGSAVAMARDLAARVNSAGLESNVAIADNPDSAMHAACGFTGTTVIPAGEEARRLGILPLHVLLDSFDMPRPRKSTSSATREREQLREQMLDTLERWGVRDFRTLALLPEHALASRLGEAGSRLQRLARGAELRTLTLWEAELHFEEALELESPVETLEPLSFILNRLLEQLCARLESRALAAHELHLRLHLERRVADEETTTAQELLSQGNSDYVRQPWFERCVRLPVAMRDPKVFLKLLQLDLAAHPPGAPVLKLWIAARPAPPRSAQRGLFLPLTPEAEKLEITLARIISVVGEHRAGIASVLNTHRTDGFGMERFIAPDEAHTTTPTMSENIDPSYALRIFRPAPLITVRTADGRPTVICGPPTKSDQASLSGDVLWSAGPWRSSGEWWTERNPENGTASTGPWDREEWDVALQSQGDCGVGLYRIYRDSSTGQWFAHASYD